MKKFLATLLATGVLLFAGGANAGVISSTSAIGMPGDTRQLDVSLVSGDMTLGGAFQIFFNDAKLTVVAITGKTAGGYELAPFPPYLSLGQTMSDYFASNPFANGDSVLLANILFPDPVNAGSGTIDSIFSIMFKINNPYPAASVTDPYQPGADFFDMVDVNISGVLSYEDPSGLATFLEDPVTDFIATVKVQARNNVPEPDALALVGLALLVMVGVGRRSRMRRG